MSHEIRTPMNAIIGIANIVEKKLENAPKDDPEAEVFKDYIAQIENSSHHLLGLLNDILDLSKIEAGKIDITSEPVDLRKLSDTVRDIIRPRCEDKAITLETKFDEALDTPVISDSLRLRQVLINLLGNAVKFTPEQGRIGFDMERVDDDACGGDTGGVSGADGADGADGAGNQIRVRFTVTDNGIGISEDALSTIFDAFEQADGSITRQYGGTGLGLPISRNIVELLGGSIQVESELGKGSKFTFELSMERATADASGEAEDTTESETRFEDKRILVVDDVDINRLIVATLLEPTGIKVIEADDGTSAVSAFESSEPGSIDIILMDVMMPVMDGLEATERIRALERADAQTVPIIAVTANAFKEDADKAIESGMNAHLAKPIDPENLMDVLRKFLRKR